MKDKVKLKGEFRVKCYDRVGRLKWEEKINNLVVNAGLNLALNVMLGATGKPAAWYIGLIRDDNYSAIAAADTMASHAGWEEADEYSEAARQVITFAAASGQAIASSATADFSINGTETMKGAFLVDDDTKSGSAGSLFSAGLFTGGDQAVASGDTIKVSYTLSAADA